MSELADQVAEWHSVLQSHRRQCSDRVHQTADGRTFFGHCDEQFAWCAVFKQADSDVTIVSANRELVSQRLTSSRESTTNRPGLNDDGFAALLTVTLFRSCQRLALLRAVAINRESFQTQLPAFLVSVFDVFDSRTGRHIDRL